MYLYYSIRLLVQYTLKQMVKRSKNHIQKEELKSNKIQIKEQKSFDPIGIYLNFQKSKNDQEKEIFQEDDNQQALREQDRNHQQIQNQIQPQISALPSHSMLQQQVSIQLRTQISQNLPSSAQTIKRAKKTKILNDPILHSSIYHQVKELDFQIFTRSLQRMNMYGSMLIDCYGRILWTDKLAHELFEGSLNNFDTMKIQDLLLQIKLDFFLQKLKNIDFSRKRITLKWAIYSKLLKRRYKDRQLPSNPKLQDYFDKYAKCVTVRIRPISIKIDSYQNEFGYCNQQLLNQSEEHKCFYLEVRKSRKNIPCKDLNLLKDPIIRKFMTKKQEKEKKPVRPGKRILDAYEQQKKHEGSEMDEIFQESSQTAKKNKKIAKKEKKDGDKSIKKPIVKSNSSDTKK